MIQFSPSSIPLKQRWRKNGLSADFLADYFSIFFPGDVNISPAISQQAEIKSAIHYIANELLENAMKFNDETSRYPISIALHLQSDQLVFLSVNSISPQNCVKFQTFIQELITSDPSEMYIRQIEGSAADDSSTISGLGTLTMINDYMARVGWKFETVQTNPKLIAVTTMVQLAV